jgi:hypothetical membrane protein
MKILIEGVRFNMTGWWEIEVAIAADMGTGDHTDNVIFNLILK